MYEIAITNGPGILLYHGIVHAGDLATVTTKHLTGASAVMIMQRNDEMEAPTIRHAD